MGQEKSLPDRYNSIPTNSISTQTTGSYRTNSTISSSSTSRPPSRAPSSTKSCTSYTSTNTSTTTTTTSTSTSTDKQTKYLKEQLYIKSYLDIVEQDKTAKNNFQPAKPGIRNYTPKILVAAEPKKELDVWI